MTDDPNKEDEEKTDVDDDDGPNTSKRTARQIIYDDDDNENQAIANNGRGLKVKEEEKEVDAPKIPEKQRRLLAYFLAKFSYLSSVISPMRAEDISGVIPHDFSAEAWYVAL